MSDLEALHEAATAAKVRLNAHPRCAPFQTLYDEMEQAFDAYHIALRNAYAAGDLIEREKVSGLMREALALCEVIEDSESNVVINAKCGDLRAALDTMKGAQR